MTTLSNFPKQVSLLEAPDFDHAILTHEAQSKMEAGTLPDLSHTCLRLYEDLMSTPGPKSALRFIPQLNAMSPLDATALDLIRQHPDTSHVLIDNVHMKAVLIHWLPDALSSIHGHREGGCVFKVLEGTVEELRYTPSDMPKLLSTSILHAGSMAYIENQMGHHAVGNPFADDAISLHVYATGV